jgi:hypothetical protein
VPAALSTNTKADGGVPTSWAPWIRVAGGEPVEEFLQALIGAFGGVLSTWLVDSFGFSLRSLEAFGKKLCSGISLGIWDPEASEHLLVLATYEATRISSAT